ncbi:unnamed protein product [Ambrosiozyma monospora]|uniref:Unnamed protein product n=1 Tax=Ambrosiozyma monospora TaxID=43982 RepID=A0ACB5U6M6_AMBMO|nr:unnamed protein product [Ambrosiozyma monospora]
MNSLACISLKYAELLAFEQLTNSKLLQTVFCGFTEGKINFGPTYKMRAVGVYDEKRLPAYTDRILFASQMDLKQNLYNCHLMEGSDHVPVYSEFTVTVDQVDQPILAQLKYKFDQYYKNVIEKMELIEIEPKVINLKTCLGMEETVTFKIHNVCEEELVYHITGGDSGLFKRTDTVLAMQMGVLAPKESKTVTMQLDPRKIGDIHRCFTVNLKDFEKLEYNKSKSIDINTTTKTIIGVD